MKTTYLLSLLFAFILLLGAAPTARTVEPLNTLNDADAAELSPFDFALRQAQGRAQDRPFDFAVGEPVEPQGEPFSVLSVPSVPSAVQSYASDWHIECVDCPPNFDFMTDRSLRLDDEGHPHIAYGGDHLYYAWYDGTQWHVETVDNAQDVGAYASLALDSRGRPHISYSDGYPNHGLKYARWTGDTWDIQTVDDTVVKHTSLALDANDHPHISYKGGHLKYAHWTGSAWDIQTVDSERIVGYHNSLALDAAGNPHISYGGDGHLKYARWTGNTWDIQTVDGGSNPSLVLDAAGHPHISYQRTIVIAAVNTNPHRPDAPPYPPKDYYHYLQYAHWTGDVWDIQVIAEHDADYLNYSPSLSLDTAGIPHVSYRNNNSLAHVYRTGDTWDIQTVDSDGFVGEYTSLAVDATGQPHISYVSHPETDTSYNLKYARWTGSVWDIQTVDREGSVGEYTSLALDIYGHTHTSYYDESNRDLKYAHWMGHVWDIQMVDGEGDVGKYTSLALDASGHPHISYAEETRDYYYNLKYARWMGDHWYIQTVDSDGDVGAYTSLALDAADHPHIAYFDDTNDKLKYAYRTGQEWDIRAVDCGGPHTSLALDGTGHPHISTQCWGLKYMHWTGQQWDIQTLDDEGTIWATSLALDVFGHPHISYYTAYPHYFKYAHWTGDAWDIQALHSGDYTGEYTSLALEANGHPHVSYRRWRILQYARWTGSGWNIQTVEDSGGLSRHTSLVLDADGNPHISYHAATYMDRGNLKYATRYSPPLALRKRATPSEGLQNNDTLTYTLTLTGPGLGVRLWDPLPPSIRYVSGSITGTVTPSAVYSSTVRAVIWQGTLPTDTVLEVRFQVTADVAGTGLSPVPIVNTAWLTETESGVVISSTASVNVMPPPFSLHKQATPSDGLRNNDTLTYTLTISGPGLNIRLWDPLPPSVRYVADSITGTVTPTAVYSPTARAVIWQGTLPTDTAQTVRFRVTPGITGTGSLSLSRPIVNTARLTDTESGWSVSAMVIVNGWRLYVPVVLRQLP